MKKSILLAILVFTFGFIAQAQEIREGVYPFIKKGTSSANGLRIELDGKPDHVEAVVERELKELTGQKVKDIKSGVSGLEAARIADFSDATLDYYYKVEKLSKKVDNRTVLTLFLSAGNYNFLNSDKYPEEMAAAAVWLDALQQKVHVYEYELLIEDQEKLIKEAKKDQEKLVSEHQKLEKQQEGILKAIDENEKAQEQQIEKIAAEEGKLAEMKETLVNMDKK